VNEQPDLAPTVSRRELLRSLGAVGTAAVASLLTRDGWCAEQKGTVGTHFPPTAKRVIYLFQSGAPSHIDLFDHKPKLAKRFGEQLPESIRKGQRLTGMTANQKSHPIAPSIFKFRRHGESGVELSETLPRIASVADDLCLVRSMHTEAINHDPAITFLQTGTERTGRPSIGAWASYGLGSEAEDLPAFVVMISRGTGRPNGQPLYQRLWGSGFIPTQYQGVKLRSGGDPVLYLSNPPGFTRDDRQQMLSTLKQLNKLRLEQVGDAEIETRIAQYEMAFRMQRSVPQLIDFRDEPQYVLDEYGSDARKPGTYAYNCLLARRLAERGVRFIQLYHRGWDQHRDLPNQLKGQCRDTDQASAALIKDLKRRGMLEDTLVIWGGEFGRTVYCQEKLQRNSYGRDHHPRCFSIWMAGGGIRGGQTYGRTDEFGYNIVEKPVEVHDLHATMLHCLGIDHHRLTFSFQGRQYRLTDVRGRVVQDWLA